jgi:hypothetical protein
MSYSLTQQAKRAYAIAVAHGSYIHATDPGACFYAFKPNDGRPANEAHRKECLLWLAYCLQSAKNRLHSTRNNPRRQSDAMDARADIADLKWLQEWFEGCPLADLSGPVRSTGVVEALRKAG